MPLTRRELLQLTGASAVGAGLLVACQVPQRELEVQSPSELPEDLVTGLENWYASVCRQCPAGCGIIGRVIEGRVKKIEGNPLYPLNQGKSCARGQAGLQVVYHPDRIQGPLQLDGVSGNLRPRSWDSTLNLLVARMKELREAGRAKEVLFITEPLSGHLALVVKRFVEAYGGQHLAFEPLEQTVLRTAIRGVFGQELLPDFDIQNADFLLSFGADFLETWLSPVRYNRGYGNFRQGAGRQRGTFVQVQSRFSMSAANADEWLYIKPGTEGVMALSLAYVMISEGLADPEAAEAMTGGQREKALQQFNPDAAASETGIPAERIRELARAFAKASRSLALGGGAAGAHTNGLSNLTAIYALNRLVGNVGRPGGVILNPSSPLELPLLQAAPVDQWQEQVGRLRDKKISLVLVHNANPVYGLPASVGFGEALRDALREAGKINIVSFSSFVDETTELADLVLPDHTYLESWGDDVPDPGPGFQTLGMQQPTVNPFHDTRAFADVLLTVAEEVDPELKKSLPWNSFVEALQEGAQQLFELNRGSVRAGNFEQFWNLLLQQGGWWDTEARFSAKVSAPPKLPTEGVRPSFSGQEQDYPFYLVPFPSLSLTDGRGAHLPWLQATPDPVTTVVWETWAELSLKDARELGIKEGDVLRVESPSGSIEVPVYPHPAAPWGVIAIPLGQGHTVFTRYGRQRGANVLSMLAPQQVEGTGSLAWAATRVKITVVGRRHRISKFEGVVTPLPLTEKPIAQITRG